MIQYDSLQMLVRLLNWHKEQMTDGASPTPYSVAEVLLNCGVNCDAVSVFAGPSAYITNLIPMDFIGKYDNAYRIRIPFQEHLHYGQSLKVNSEQYRIAVLPIESGLSSTIDSRWEFGEMIDVLIQKEMGNDASS